MCRQLILGEGSVADLLRHIRANKSPGVLLTNGKLAVKFAGLTFQAGDHQAEQLQVLRLHGRVSTYVSSAPQAPRARYQVLCAAAASPSW